MSSPAKTKVFVWEKRYIATHFNYTAHVHTALYCTNYGQKPGINIYYTSDMQYFFLLFF